MSEIRVENIIGETGNDAVKFTKGINVTGIATATNVSVGSSVTATNFYGSGANLTGIESGLTVAQQWRLTATKNITTSRSFVTSDWEAVDTTAYGAISSLSESSGVFTFPATGIYLIRFIGAHESTGAINWSQTEIHTTTDNGTYTNASSVFAIFPSAYNTTNAIANFIFDVTNTSTHKVKFSAYTNRSSVLFLANSTAYEGNSFIFLKLGDT